MRPICYTLLIALAGCSANMNDRLREQFFVTSASFNKLKDKNIVRESLGYPSEEFVLAAEPHAHPLETSRGDFPVQLLRGIEIPLHERMIFAIIDPVKDTISPEFEFELLDEGKVKVFGKNGVETTDEIPFILSEGLLTAKPVHYAIVSKKYKTSATASFVPYPLEARGENGQALSLTVTHPMLTRFRLQGTGFAAGETVTVQHHSGPKHETFELVANEEGTIEAELQPLVIGTLGGEAAVSINGLTLDYPWGNQLEKKTFRDRSLFPTLFVINQLPEEINDLKVKKSFASLHLGPGNP